MASMHTLSSGMRVGRFTVVHVLPRRVRLKSAAFAFPGFDATYFQALLEALPGVNEVRVNVKGHSLIIAFDGLASTWERIERYLRQLPEEVYHSHYEGIQPVQWSNIFLKTVLGLLAHTMPHPIRVGVSWAVCLDVIMEGIETALFKGLKVQVLDALAVGLSLLRGNYLTATTISSLLSIGEGLEEQSEQRSASLLKNLLRPQVDSLWVMQDGSEISIPIEEVEENDLAVFGAGESIVIDGVVEEGEASVNQSSISGESIPVHCKPGDAVISVSVVEEGRLVVRVTKTGSETSVARIGRFIDQSLRNQSKRQSKSSELADKLVPVTIGLSGLVWLVNRDITRATSVLTVDYSCAIKLTSPIAVRSGIYAAGLSGALIKGANALDALQDVDTVVFDKTGTLTTGNLAVTDVIAFEGYDEKEVLCLAAGAEEHYDHPVARAVVNEANRQELTLPKIRKVDFIVAHGVSAMVEKKNILVGSYHFIAEDEQIPCDVSEKFAHTLRKEGKSLLYVASDNVLIGIIAMRDELRPEAAEVLSTLKKQGVKQIVVLTGDHKETALALHEELSQLDTVLYELKPEDKADAVIKLKQEGHFVAFVGDGVNDAPALVNAHVGICMPKGADLAKESAQVLLLKEDLHAIVAARAVATRTNTLIKRCFYSTIAFNTATIVMALGGLSPVSSALLHNLSTVGTLTYAGLASSKPLELT